MSRIYKPADPEVVELVRKVLVAECQQIAGMQPEIIIETLFAFESKPGKPALTKGGYPCVGMIRVVTEEHRAAAAPDVILTLDGYRWSKLSSEEQYAVIHHELYHLVPVNLKPATGDAKGWYCAVDGLGRPKIRLRRHDWQIGGFNKIVELHGDHAIEWQEVERVHEAFHQRLLPFTVEAVDGVAQFTERGAKRASKSGGGRK